MGGLNCHLLQTGNMPCGHRRYAVLYGIELESLYESANLRVGLVLRLSIGRVINGTVPIAFRNFSYAVPAIQYILPESVPVQSLGDNHSYTDNRNFLFLHKILKKCLLVFARKTAPEHKAAYNFILQNMQITKKSYKFCFNLVKYS